MKAKAMSKPKRSKDNNYYLPLRSASAHSFWWQLREQKRQQIENESNMMS